MRRFRAPWCHATGPSRPRGYRAPSVPRKGALVPRYGPLEASRLPGAVRSPKGRPGATLRATLDSKRGHGGYRRSYGNASADPAPMALVVSREKPRGPGTHPQSYCSLSTGTDAGTHPQSYCSLPTGSPCARRGTHSNLHAQMTRNPPKLPPGVYRSVSERVLVCAGPAPTSPYITGPLARVGHNVTVGDSGPSSTAILPVDTERLTRTLEPRRLPTGAPHEKPEVFHLPTGWQVAIPAPLEIQPADRSEPGFSSFLGPREDKIF